MNGIVFFQTAIHDEVVRFHLERLGGQTWLEQPACTIIRHGNLLVGFCRADPAQTDGLVTLFSDDRADVEELYRRLGDVATSELRYNEIYGIFHFYGSDPEGRAFEVQCFDERPEL